MRIFIADGLGGAGKAYGYIECGSLATRVTWCFGHLLEEAPPEEYVPGEGAQPEDLPVIPERWKLSPRDGAAGKQVNMICELLKAATEIANARDADREGQLLVDGSARRALVTLKPNAALAPLYESALARQRCWRGRGIRPLWKIPDDLLTDGLLPEKAAAEATASAVRGRPARAGKFTHPICAE